MGSLSLLQAFFLTQGSNPGLPHCRRILYQLSHQASPRTLEWVTESFSSASSWPGCQTGVCCTAGGFFTSWAIGETPLHSYPQILAFCSKRRGRNNKRHSMDFYREFAKQIVPFFVEIMQFRFSLSLLDLPQWEHLVSACSVLDNLLVTWVLYLVCSSQ